MGSHGPPNRGKGLDDLMMAYTDLSSKTKTSGFRGPPVKDLKTTNPKSANTFQTSNKSRDWSTFNMDLETAFSPNPPPPCQTQPFVPHPQLLLQKTVYHPVQPSFIHPPAATQDTDEWGDFQDFSAPEQPLSLPHNPFTVVNTNPKNPPSLPPAIPLHQVSNLNIHPNTAPSHCNISFSSIPANEKAANEPTSDFDDFQDFVSAPPINARSMGSPFVPKSSLKPSAVSLPPTKDLIQSEQLSEAIGSRLATFQDESPVHRFKSSGMPQATAATAATSALDDDFGDFSLPTIGRSPAVTLLPQPSRSDASTVLASDKYSVFRDFLESSQDGVVTSSDSRPLPACPPSPSADLLNSSAETLITLPPSNPPQPFSLLSKQSPTISLNTSADILLAPSTSNNDDFGDFASFEFSNSSANLGTIVTPTNPFVNSVFSSESPDDEWSLPCCVPPPLPASSTWISSSPPPPEYQLATKSSPKTSDLNVEEFSLPSEQLELSDRELFGTRAYEEPNKKATVNSLQGIYNMHLTVKNPAEDDCEPCETENEFDLCSVMVSSPLREKCSSPDSMLSSLPVPAKSSETQSVASLELESPGESASRHDSVVSLELSEAKTGGEEMDSPYNEWTLTLKQISDLIDTVREIYTAQADEVKLELAESEEGFAYLSNLLEVYKVYKRIATAVENRGNQEMQQTWINSQCEHIEESWRGLAAHVPGGLLSTALYSATCSSGSSSCGLCLQDVASTKLWYAGKEYHAACANLWVNSVDSVLPSLSI